MPYGPVTPSSAMEDVVGYIELLNDVADARRDLVKMGEPCEDFCTHYRALGICMLSGDADIDGFFHCLVQSALTRRYYLEGIQTVGGGEAYHRRASFIAPVFDAIVARQWGLAEDILRSVSQTWLEGEEYEDDFCYADFFRRLLTEGRAGTDQLFSRWEEVLDGGVDRRLDVAKALHLGAATAFSEALTTLLASEEAKARAIAHPITGSLRADEITFFPNLWVSVEGLALLAIAERQGLDLSEDFSTCPPLVRDGVFGAFHSRGYPHVPFRAE